MTNIILIRHGETDWSKAGRIQGQLDIPLNGEGKRQIDQILKGMNLIEESKRIESVYSSQLSRSFETAEAIGRNFGVPVNRLRALNELNQGVWQGLLAKQIRGRNTKLYKIWRARPLATKPPKGEGLQEAYDRIISAVQKIVSKHADKTSCIVTHEITSAIIKCHYKNIDLNDIWDHLPKNASCELIRVEHE